MKDDSIVDFISNINKIKNDKSLINYIDILTIDDKTLNTLNSTTLISNEHELGEIVEELELNLAFFLLNEDSTINQLVRNKLSNIGITIGRINSGMFYLNFESFCILFSI